MEQDTVKPRVIFQQNSWNLILVSTKGAGLRYAKTLHVKTI